ncbi:MAG: membrane protease YdiL (CAAX protease family) [Candidatus Paceibacteria bacterium]|jgi:membrane protease YdiL (CAAX protease family)
MLILESSQIKYIELLVLYTLLPLALVSSLSVTIKVISVAVAFAYVLYLLYLYTGFKVEKVKKEILPAFWKRTLITLIPVTIFGLFFVLTQAPDAFFRLITTDIKFWLLIVFIYSVGSVLPQEVIYRNIFWRRYRELFSNTYIFIITNAALFSLSHIFLESWIVIGVTFAGGLLFGFTYEKTKSTLLVTTEHSLYGLVLFTIGIGALLAFPS